MTLIQDVRLRRSWFLLSGLVVLVDQLSKLAVHAWLPGKGAVPVIPGFLNLAYSRNPGGLFGAFGSWGAPSRTLLLTVLPVLAIGLIGVFLARVSLRDRAVLSGFALILGGAVGNLIDRLTRGEVVDFLDVYASSSSLARWFHNRFGTAHWPTFNLADSAIVTGVCLLTLDAFRSRKRARDVEEN